MVQVRDNHPQTADDNVDIDRWLSQLPIGHDIDAERLKRACIMSQTARDRTAEQSDYHWHEAFDCVRIGLEMAEILADLHLDEETLIAALLYRAVREGRLTLEAVAQAFGKTIVRLLNDVLRMAIISRANADQPLVLGHATEQTETMRKMLVSLVDDVRVALLKLAERTCAIRAVKHTPDRQYRVAREVFDIYAPLAHRLGIGQIKWELEDLSFRYLHPAPYQQIARLLDSTRRDRQVFIEDIQNTLREALQNSGISADLSGRAKHIYSIWRKMQRKNIAFSQVYDIHALRIMVNDIKDCYASLGIAHGLWRNIADEFDDYIANPKENGYRSLHTAVVGPQGKFIEIQIRTTTMHEEAELGVCAHWRYKGSDQNSSGSYEEKIAWLRQILEWHEETSGSSSDVVAEHFSHIQDRVYVFTPDGHVVSLAQGSTPLDFAYHIHTEVGHHCIGAKTNGHIVPLTYALQTGEQLEIITSKQSTPRRAWLQPDLGYLMSSRARSKVKRWFKQQAREDNITAGKALIDSLRKRLSLSELNDNIVARRFGYDDIDSLYAAVGAGDINTQQLTHALPALIDQPSSHAPTVELKAPSQRTVSSDEVVVGGVGNLLTQMAGCCKPLPGDAIIGYVTAGRGRGVSIHRQDCSKLLQLQHSEPARIITVDWEAKHRQTYPVTLLIEAFDRSDLLSDITTLLAKAKLAVRALNSYLDKENNTARIHLTVEMTSLEALTGLLGKINHLPNVFNAKRVREGG